MLGLIGNAFGGESQESVRFAVSASNTTTFVAEIARSVVGVAMAIAFGQTAWLGNVVVSPAWRRRGLGRTLTERALQHALEEADTVLLLALGEAQRIYERLGFVADGLYGTWTRQDQPAAAAKSVPAVAQPAATAAALSGASLAEQCLSLDRAATGEDRRSYLEYFVPVARVAYADRLRSPRKGGGRLQRSAFVGHRRHHRRRPAGRRRPGRRPAGGLSPDATRVPRRQRGRLPAGL